MNGLTASRDDTGRCRTLSVSLPTINPDGPLPVKVT